MSTWEVLSKIDCNAHVDKKGNFSYLSWTWAWAMVKERFPEAIYTIDDDVIYPDGTREVRCTVTIDGLSHQMWLPVLNYQNKAIANPNAFDVNSSRMRCLVKCLAMFGLGHYIYAGESLPQESDPYTPEQLATFKMLIASEDGWGLKLFGKEVGQPAMDALFNSAPKNEKTKLKSACRDAVQAANNQLKLTLLAIRQAISDDSVSALDEIFGEIEPGSSEHTVVMQGITEIEHIQIAKMREEAA